VPLSGDGSLAPVELLEQLGRVVDDSSVDGRVIDRDTAFGHHLFQVPEAQAVSEIPPDAQQNYRAVEIAAFEHHKPPELAGGID
jgi:hypothetical protein